MAAKVLDLEAYRVRRQREWREIAARVDAWDAKMQALANELNIYMYTGKWEQP